MTRSKFENASSQQQPLANLSFTSGLCLQANEAENEIGNIRGFYSKLQDALDRQTRGALRAATNLEKTTNQLAAPHLLSNVGSQSQEALLSIQSDLLTCLSALKGSLWQLLVLSVDECAASPP